MISIHRVAAVAAKISTNDDSHWLNLTLTEPDGETKVDITIYFSTRKRGFTEERRYTRELAEAINSVKPMDIGDWGAEEAQGGPTAPLRPTVADDANWKETLATWKATE